MVFPVLLLWAQLFCLSVPCRMGCLLIRQSPQLAGVAGSNLTCSIVEKSLSVLKTKPNQQWGEKKINCLKENSLRSVCSRKGSDFLRGKLRWFILAWCWSDCYQFWARKIKSRLLAAYPAVLQCIWALGLLLDFLCQICLVTIYLWKEDLFRRKNIPSN